MRVDGLPNDEVIEDMVDTFCIKQEPTGFFFIGEGICTLADLLTKSFFVIQHIECNEDRHDKIQCQTAKAVYVGCDGFDQFRSVLRHMLDRCQHTVDNTIYICRVDIGDLVEDVANTFIHGFRVNGDVCRKGHDGIADLGQQIDHDPDCAADDDRIHQQDTEGSGQLFMFSAECKPFQEFFLKEHHEGIHDIGDGEAHDEGGHQIAEIGEPCGDRCADGRNVADHFFKKDQSCCNDKDIKTGFAQQFVMFISVSSEKIKFSHNCSHL